MTFEVQTRYSHTPRCVLHKNEYYDNHHIALSIFSLEDGPFADITVNLPSTAKFPKNFGFVDTNNFPEAPALIERLGIGRATPFRDSSVFCTYPMYEFDEDAINTYTSE